MLKFNYVIPIKESIYEDNSTKEMVIEGIAISATTTGNNHKFLPEELELSAHTLNGVPLLVDHENKVECIKGRVINANWDNINLCIPFKAKVMDEMCKQMIRDGRLNSVSVGAQVKEVDELNGELIPHGITFRELSLVAVPADPNAVFNSFDIALKEAYTIKPIKENIEDEENEQDEEEKEFTDKPQEEQETPIEPIDEKIQLNKENLKGGKKMSEEVGNVDFSKELLEKITLLTKEVEELKNSNKVEAKEEIEENENGEYQIIEGYKNFTLIKNKY
jgi:hypothetical protein